MEILAPIWLVILIIAGIVNLLGSLLFLPAVKLASRKNILISSSVIMSLALAVHGELHGLHYLSVYTFQIPASNCQTNEEAGENSWISLICILVYMLSAPIGLCSIPFMYIAELYPREVMSCHVSLTEKITLIIFR